MITKGEMVVCIQFVYVAQNNKFNVGQRGVLLYPVGSQKQCSWIRNPRDDVHIVMDLMYTVSFVFKMMTLYHPISGIKDTLS